MEGPFLHERQRRRRDSRLVTGAPEAAFLASFKEALLASGTQPSRPGERRSFFTYPEDDGTQTRTDPLVRRPYFDRLQYPLMLFADLPPLPNSDVLRNLIAIFHQRVVPSTPFLKELSLPGADTAPPYLALPMALLGAAALPSKENDHLEETLWYASNNIMTGALEIDNSTASRMDMVEAGLLLILCGVMQANADAWHKTQTCSGYVDTSMDRLMRKEARTWSDSPSGIDCKAMSSLICFYFFVDTLRAAHLQTLPILIPSQTSFLFKSGHSFQDLYTTVAIDHTPLPTGLTSDTYLVLLLAILSDILSLTHIAGAYLPHNVAYGGTFHHNAESTDAVLDDLGQASGDSSQGYYNPFLPSTTTSEYFAVSRRLRSALDAFCTSTTTEASTIDPTIIPLMHYCRMVLDVGPIIHILPVLAGYTPQHQPTDGPPPIAASQTDWEATGIQFNNAAVSSAWQILETVDSDHRYRHPNAHDASLTQLITPVWYPIIIFQAALVLWGQTMEKKDTGSSTSANANSPNGVVLAKKKVFGTFERELEQMNPAWGCIRRMIDIIKALK